MSDLKLEDHYKVELDAVKGLYKYKSCRTQNIPLFGHQVLPQNLIYGKPCISPNGKYISIIGKGKGEDKAFIWEMENLDSYLYSYTSMSIEDLFFSPDSKYFYILYKEEPPIKHEIKSGKEILTFKYPEEPISNIICHAFSSDGRSLILGTENYFISWNVNDGKISKIKKEESHLKVIKNDLQISLKDNLEGLVFKNFEPQRNKVKINNIKNIQDILACEISPDKNYLYYATKNAISRYNLKTDSKNNPEELIKYEDVEKIIINEECTNVILTDMSTISFWDLKSKNNDNVIFKEKFTSIALNFKKKLLCIVDDLCINITNLEDSENNNTEKFIWLNDNPKKFLYFTFSPDFKVLLATLDENNAISYNTETGRVIKKWRNMEDDWSMACEMAPETSQIAVIATKSDPKTIKIWDYNNGKEVLSLTDYNVHSFNFNENGQLLACGAREGEEVARIWDLTDCSYSSFFFKGKNNNLYTIVNLTNSLDNSDNKKLILASIGQAPIVFDVNTQKLLYECECPINFEKILGIQSNIKYDCFLVKGRDTQKKNMALLYRLSDGKLIQIYDNYYNVDLAKDESVIISRSSNINEGNLTISNIENLEKIENKNCQLQAENSCFLQDNKSIVSAFGYQKKLKFILSEVQSGKMIAEIKYTQNFDRHAEIDLSVNKEENIIILRYIEFVEPLEE
jgi:WD40 repeat protein